MLSNRLIPSAGAPKILVIDDQPELLELLQRWFGLLGYQLFSAKSGAEARELMATQAYDVLVVDVDMPGVEDARIGELGPGMEVILVGTACRSWCGNLAEGDSYVCLEKPLKNLGTLSQAIQDALGRRRGERPAPRPAAPALTPREVEIVRALAKGLDNRTLAEQLSVSEKTIKNHLTRVYEKLGVKNRTQAVLFCQQLGLF